MVQPYLRFFRFISSPADLTFNCQRTGDLFGISSWDPAGVLHSSAVAADDRHVCVVLEKGLAEVWTVLCQVTAHVYSKKHTWMFLAISTTLIQTKMRTYKTCIAPAICEKEREREWMRWRGESGHWSSDSLKWWSCHVVMTRAGDDVKWQFITWSDSDVTWAWCEIVLLPSAGDVKWWYVEVLILAIAPKISKTSQTCNHLFQRLREQQKNESAGQTGIYPKAKWFPLNIPSIIFWGISICQ